MNIRFAIRWNFRSKIAAIALISVATATTSQFFIHRETPACSLSQDAERGRQWANTCKSCHDIDVQKPISPRGGPNLHDVYQSLAGTVSVKYDYRYGPPSEAARVAGIVWTDDNLDRYLQGPEAFLSSA